MADQGDLFGGYRPAQGSLFGEAEGRLDAAARRTLPDPENVRRRLMALIEKARSAETMPWPEHEAQQLHLEFVRELERLTRAA